MCRESTEAAAAAAEAMPAVLGFSKVLARTKMHREREKEGERVREREGESHAQLQLQSG